MKIGERPTFDMVEIRAAEGRFDQRRIIDIQYGSSLANTSEGDRWSDVDNRSFQDCMNVNICEVTSLKEARSV